MNFIVYLKVTYIQNLLKRLYTMSKIMQAMNTIVHCSNTNPIIYGVS